MEKTTMFCIPEGRFKVQKIVEFVHLNSSFDGEVYIRKNNRIINAKSILGTMGLLIPSKTGEEFMIIVKGGNADDDIQQITDFLEMETTTMSKLNLWDQEGIENVNIALNDSQSHWTPFVQSIAKAHLTMK